MAEFLGTPGPDLIVGVISSSNFIFGFRGDDILFGYGFSDRIEGGTGADELYGLEGDDTLSGGDDDDFIDADAGNDELYGGDGDDDIYLGQGSDLVFAGDGDDEISTISPSTSRDLSLPSDTETIYLEAGDDYVLASIGGDLIDGGRGQDVVSYYGRATAGVEVNLRTGRGAFGYAERDTYRFVEDVVGSYFNDTLIGNGVSNVLEGRGGDDWIKGGIGADFLFGDAGVDTLNYAESWAGVTINLETGLATGGDALGDEFFDFEWVSGSGYADTLTGNAGENLLWGEAGADVLRGGGGADFLNGGAGADRFVFGATSESTVDFAGRDKIIFSLNGGDVIDLRLMDANVGVGGNQAFSFLGTGAFTGSGGEVRYRKTANETIVYGDVDGDTVADFGIELIDPVTLTVGDFLL